MYKDYKNRIPALNERKPPQFRKLAFLGGAGVLVAIILGVGMFVASSQKKLSSAALTTPDPTQSSSLNHSVSHRTEPTPELPKKIEPRFTFYKILSEKEVIIPDSEVKTIRREELTSKNVPTGRYYIQVGSFINQQDAEKLKADMVQIKIPAKLEMIQVDNSTWFRVKVGPYATLSEVERVRHYLRTHRVDSVVQKNNR